MHAAARGCRYRHVDGIVGLIVKAALLSCACGTYGSVASCKCAAFPSHFALIITTTGLAPCAAWLLSCIVRFARLPVVTHVDVPFVLGSPPCQWDREQDEPDGVRAIASFTVYKVRCQVICQDACRRLSGFSQAGLAHARLHCSLRLLLRHSELPGGVCAACRVALRATAKLQF
jgi:hypothetical protein